MNESPKKTTGHPQADQLQEYTRQKTLFDIQPPIIQRFLEVQGRQVAEAFTGRVQHIRFTLPDRVVIKEKAEPIPVIESVRNQSVGTFNDRLAKRDAHITLKVRLTELESAPEEATAISAGLVRFAAAQHMVYNMLPSGRAVQYQETEGEEIPSLPISDVLEPESAITAETDAIAEEVKPEDGRGSLQVPYVPAARRFYLPQWVAFDEQGKILVNSVEEAEAHIASMQRFLDILFAARSIAPYMVADDEFEKKRYGMLGQLVNQGRALALYTTRTIIETIKRRAAAQSLNRGLSLSLPYFDDQDLVIKNNNFVVIPAGRIMFIPAFVVRAAQEEQAKISQDTRLSPSTRKHLLEELSLLEESFETR